MKSTIHLIRRLFTKGRRYRRMGISTEALTLFKRIASMPQLPKAVLEKTHMQLALVHAEIGQLARARRHLQRVATLNPQRAAQCHYRIARLAQRDPRCSVRFVARNYRQALCLDSSNACFLTAFASFSFKTGKRRRALNYWRQAIELAPQDAQVWKSYLRGMADLKRFGEAGAVIRTWQFRLGGLPWFRELTTVFRFALLCHCQKPIVLAREQPEVEEHPRVLPFRVLDGATAQGATSSRRDAPGILRSPYFTQRLPGPDQRRAQ